MLPNEDKDGEEKDSAAVQRQLAKLLVDYARTWGVWKGGRLEGWDGNEDVNDGLLDRLEQIPDDADGKVLEGIFWALYGVDMDLRDGATQTEVKGDLEALLEMVMGAALSGGISGESVPLERQLVRQWRRGVGSS